MGGTSIGATRAAALSTSLRRVEPEPRGTLLDTLLGPEGTGNRSFETDARQLMLSGVSVGARSAVVLLGTSETAPHHDRDTRPYLENCTVDASI
jgi:hypothetical protein